MVFVVVIVEIHGAIAQEPLPCFWCQKKSKSAVVSILQSTCLFLVISILLAKRREEKSAQFCQKNCRKKGHFWLIITFFVFSHFYFCFQFHTRIFFAFPVHLFIIFKNVSKNNRGSSKCGRFLPKTWEVIRNRLII